MNVRDSAGLELRYRQFDDRLQAWFDTKPNLTLRPLTWEMGVALATLVIVLAQWALIAAVLGGVRDGDSATTWFGYTTEDISAIYRWGFFAALPGCILAAGNRSWGHCFALLGIFLPQVIGGIWAWNLGRCDAHLGYWHQYLLFQTSFSATAANANGVGFAPIDWPIAVVLRTGLLGRTSLSLIWMQAFALALSIPALARLLRLDFEERPRLLNFVLYAYAFCFGWSTLLFDAGRVCWVPVLLFSLVWAARRSRHKRMWFYGSLLLSTGTAGALLLAGYGLHSVFRRRVGLGILHMLAAWLYGYTLGCGVSAGGMGQSLGTAIESFSAHDRGLFDFLVAWACLPLLAPEVLAAGIPAAIGALFQVFPSDWMWPGAWAALLAPIFALGSARVLALWSKSKLPGLWMAAAVLLTLTAVKAVDDWPGRLERIPVDTKQRDTVMLLNGALERLESIGKAAETRLAIPGPYLERVSHVPNVSIFPDDWRGADWVIATIEPPAWPRWDSQEYRAEILALHRDPDWGLVERRGDSLLFQRGLADYASLALPEDRWDARVVSYELPARVVAGSTFTGTVTVENLGSETWTNESDYVLGTWQECDPFQDGGSARARMASPVTSGERMIFTLPTMTAPAQAGDYATRWGMVQEHVRWFGEILDVTVTVDAP